MQESIRHFVQICAEHLPLAAPIIEFGAYQVTESAQEDLRTLFPGMDYIGADMRPGPGVDRVLDLHDLAMEAASVNTVLCLDTLEHVEYPRRAMEEMQRVLRPGGTLIISSVFEFPIHGHPNDFWRFTPEGFRSLLSIFPASFVASYGRSSESPQSVVGVGFNGPEPDLAEFRDALAYWSRRYSNILKKLSESPSQS